MADMIATIGELSGEDSSTTSGEYDVGREKWT